MVTPGGYPQGGPAWHTAVAGVVLPSCVGRARRAKHKTSSGCGAGPLDQLNPTLFTYCYFDTWVL